MQQARAEQEEEFISNTLFKKIQALQKEKETLAVNYEKEEEFLTNDLSRKLMQVTDQISHKALSHCHHHHNIGRGIIFQKIKIHRVDLKVHWCVEVPCGDPE